ncbi:MAG: PspC domain-containing protein [Cyclobacteriaceae bacterium]|nr:PspC domain-containing protein [Cyclobacteriaceae bacterium]MCH8515037.1 PspC domain-containing protein [Cyclobacteriaceae bacterium]
MKKSISISISAIVFHVEEDGYEQLKKYLDAVTRYFSSFEDSQEIVDDIERRIAEKFLAKLKGSQQVVTLSDVDEVISVMGTVADFEAMNDGASSDKKEEESKTEEANEDKSSLFSLDEDPKRMIRNLDNRLIGGVASGIAYRLKVDPLWVRIIALLGFFNFFIPASLFFGISPLSPIVFLSYVVLWIALPSRKSLPEQKKVRKLYRDREDAVVGGVSKGLAHYFGVDPVIFRVLFVVLSFIYLIGVLIYLVLWVITPQAKSITQKMEMKGDPINIENIEKSIKNSFTAENTSGESAASSILLFPFRMIGKFGTWASTEGKPVFSFLLQLIVILASAFLLLLGITFLVQAFTLPLIYYGLTHNMGLSQFLFYDLGVDELWWIEEHLKATLPHYIIIAFSITNLLLGVLLFANGLAILIRRKAMKATFNAVCIAITIVAFVVMVIGVISLAAQFKSNDSIINIDSYPLDSEGVYFDNIENSDAAGVSIKYQLKQSIDSVMHISKEVFASGSSKSDARKHASQTYVYYEQFNDSTWSFEKKLRLDSDAKWRNQSAKVSLMIPEGTPITLAPSLLDVFSLSPKVLEAVKQGKAIYFKEGRLSCDSCDENLSSFTGNKDQVSLFFGDNSLTEPMVIGAVNEIVATGIHEIKIIVSDEPFLRYSAEGESRLEDLKIEEKGNRLYLLGERKSNVRFNFFNFIRNFEIYDDRFKILIGIPDLEMVKLSGGNKLVLGDFRGNDLKIKLSGASDLKSGFIQYDLVNLELSGASKVNLKGEVNSIDARFSGASKADLMELKANSVKLRASGATKADVYASEELSIDLSGASSLRYKGGANVSSQSISGGSKIRSID